jgi:hypothetical protein
LLFVACSLAAGVSAQTVEVASVPAVASAQPPFARFSLGAGLGLSFDVGNSGFIGTAGYGSSRAFTSNVVTPTGTALFEVAVTRGVRLMLGMSGSYTKKIDAKSDVPNPAPESTWLLGGGIGVRWVLNPGGVVELSPALLLGVHGGRVNEDIDSVTDSNGVPYMTRYDEVSLGTDARFGIVLEHALLPNLHVRFEAYFLRAGYDRFASRTNGVISRNVRMGLGWGLAPSLMLRLSL